MGNIIWGCVKPETRKGDGDQNRRKRNLFSLNNRENILDAPTGHDIGQHYRIGEEIGHGEFGITHLCTEISTGKNYACKLISKKRLVTRVDREDVRREVDIMRHLPEHPNIVSLKDTFEDDNAVYIVMELCEGGELFDRIKARKHYSERVAAALIKTIVEVVQTCHQYGVMHRDLKPENFLFADKNGNSPLKAIDFGLSVFFKPGQVFTEVVGSPYYMAPEVLKRNYGPEIDIWSAGVILYILLCGSPPFWANTEEGIACAIIQSKIDLMREPWPKVSENAKDLIKRMLEPEPKKRLNAQQVLDHPWICNLITAPDTALGESLRTRLQQFTMMNKLKKKALSVIADHLTIDEEADIKEMFEELDVEKKGELTFDELKEALHKKGHDLPDSDARMIMEAVDINGDGTLNYDEFLTVTIHIHKMANDEHLHKAFAFFDRNKTGYIEIEELAECLISDLGPNHEEVVDAIVCEVDTDKDGKISYEEFANMMNSGTDWRIASRQYSRERLNTLSWRLQQEGIVPAA